MLCHQLHLNCDHFQELCSYSVFVALRHFAEAECIVNLLIHALARLSEDRLAENALVLASALTKVRCTSHCLMNHTGASVRAETGLQFVSFAGSSCSSRRTLIGSDKSGLTGPYCCLEVQDCRF